MQLTVSGGERVAFVGSTGSGKSTLAEYLTAGLQRLVVIDPKDELGGQWGLEDWSKKGVARLMADEPNERNPSPVRLRVRPPDPSDDIDPIKYYEHYFRVCYEAGGLTVYIDELYGVTPPGKKPQPYLTALYTRGRSRGIGTWGATQRPAWVPLFTLSEAQWVFMFRLKMTEDRKRMAGIMGDDVMAPVAHKYGFWVHYSEWEAPEYTRGLIIDK